MASHTPDPDEILSRLGYRIPHIDYRTISLTPGMAESLPALPVVDRRWQVDGFLSPLYSSTLGSLGRLPAEILMLLVNMLDLGSVAQFACTSIRCNDLVLSQRSYRELVAYVPQVFVALREMGLLHVHSLATLHARLRSAQCATCREFGPFLFLPSCQRACWYCLCNCAAFRIMSLGQAREYFGLPGSRPVLAQRLDAFCMIPLNDIMFSVYPVVDIYSRGSVVTIEAARHYALAVHGSEQNVREAAAAMCETAEKRQTAAVFHRNYLPYVPAGPEALDPILRHPVSAGRFNMHPYAGATSLVFPSLPPLSRSSAGSAKEARGEIGVWCRGCEWLATRILSTEIPPEVKSALRLVTGPSLVMILDGMERRVRTTTSLLEHVRHCYGAYQIMPELADGSTPVWQYYDEQTMKTAAAMNEGKTEEAGA